MDTFLTHMQMPWSTLIFDNPMLIFSSKMSWTKWSFWRTYGFYITSTHHSSLLIDSYIRRTKKKHRSFFKNRINSVKCPFFFNATPFTLPLPCNQGGKKVMLSHSVSLSAAVTGRRNQRPSFALSFARSYSFIHSFLFLILYFGGAWVSPALNGIIIHLLRKVIIMYYHHCFFKIIIVFHQLLNCSHKL